MSGYGITLATPVGMQYFRGRAPFRALDYGSHALVQALDRASICAPERPNDALARLDSCSAMLGRFWSILMPDHDLIHGMHYGMADRSWPGPSL